MAIKSDHNNYTQLCSLIESHSLEDFLIHFCSRSYLKQLLSKKERSRPVQYKQELTLPLDLLNRGHISPCYQGQKIQVIKESEDYLVFDKPFNVHGHPLNYTDSHNCLSFLRSIQKGIYLNVNKEEYERGLLYRLDAVTSGVLIYIKKQELWRELRLHFNRVAKEKIYLAIVEGHFDQEGEHTHYFSPGGKKGSMMKVSHDKEGEEGSLELRLLDYNRKENVSLVAIRLKTGLRHQIRAQLAFLGFPILGDTLYKGKSAQRVFLHAFFYKVEWNNFLLEAGSSQADLFDLFFDLNSGLEMLGDQSRVFKSG